MSQDPVAVNGELSRGARRADLRVGYAPGAFDLFHVGHLNILRRASLLCDYLIAGVVSDDVVERQKGRRPVVPEQERLAIVAAICYVDEAVLEETGDKLAAWRSLRFNVAIKGDDWKGSPTWAQLEEAFAEVGTEVVYLPYTEHLSTSQLRGRVTASRPILGESAHLQW